jgi:hypothetical protein
MEPIALCTFGKTILILAACYLTYEEYLFNYYGVIIIVMKMRFVVHSLLLVDIFSLYLSKLVI